MNTVWIVYYSCGGGECEAPEVAFDSEAKADEFVNKKQDYFNWQIACLSVN